MSDFSTFALLTAGLAVFAPLVAAHDEKVQLTGVPGGSDPTAGAIYQPGLTDVVPAGADYTVTWSPSEDKCGKTVDLVLLNGATAVQMAPYWYVARNVANSGSYNWTVSTSLEPSESSYGLELVCVETQAYQYSTRFGISNAEYSDHHSNATNATESSSSTTRASTASLASHTSHTITATGTGVVNNGTEPTPTGALTVPSSLITTTATATVSTSTRTSSVAASAASATATGAAAALQMGASGLFAAAALAAFAL